MTLRLRPLRAGDEHSALQAHEELARESFDFLPSWVPDEGWSRYNQIAQLRAGVLPGFVPAVFLGAFVSDEPVGRVSVRFALNELLDLIG